MKLAITHRELYVLTKVLVQNVGKQKAINVWITVCLFLMTQAPPARLHNTFQRLKLFFLDVK